VIDCGAVVCARSPMVELSVTMAAAPAVVALRKSRRLRSDIGTKLRRIRQGCPMNRRDFFRIGLPVPATPWLRARSVSAQSQLPPPGADGWISLFNGRNLDGWC